MTRETGRKERVICFGSQLKGLVYHGRELQHQEHDTLATWQHRQKAAKAKFHCSASHLLFLQSSP